MGQRLRIIRRSGVIFTSSVGQHPRGPSPRRVPRREFRSALRLKPWADADYSDDVDFWDDRDDDEPIHGQLMDFNELDPDECNCDGFCKPGYCDMNPNSYFYAENAEDPECA